VAGSFGGVSVRDCVLVVLGFFLWGYLRSKRAVFYRKIKFALRVYGPKKVFDQGCFKKEK